MEKHSFNITWLHLWFLCTLSYLEVVTPLISAALDSTVITTTIKENFYYVRSCSVYPSGFYGLILSHLTFLIPSDSRSLNQRSSLTNHMRVLFIRNHMGDAPVPCRIGSDSSSSNTRGIQTGFVSVQLVWGGTPLSVWFIYCKYVFYFQSCTK